MLPSNSQLKFVMNLMFAFRQLDAEQIRILDFEIFSTAEIAGWKVRLRSISSLDESEVLTL